MGGPHLFITGTDTEVGKTFVTCQLLRAARAAGADCVGLKPLCCGERTDAEELHAAAGEVLPLDVINPVWFRTPAAPFAAAMIESRLPDLDLVRQQIRHAVGRHQHVLVEGAGGFLVPITQEFSFADLARELGWPVLVVAENRLGVLNQVLLTFEAIRQRGLACAGIVLNRPQPPPPEESAATLTNAAVLRMLTDTKVWEQEHGGGEELWRREGEGLFGARTLPTCNPTPSA